MKYHVLSFVLLVMSVAAMAKGLSGVSLPSDCYSKNQTNANVEIACESGCKTKDSAGKCLVKSYNDQSYSVDILKGCNFHLLNCNKSGRLTCAKSC